MGFQFVADDHFFTGDPRVRTSGHVWEYFTDFTWAEYDGGPATFYRPLFVLWVRLNYILNGMSPWGWHLLSIAKHAAAAILLGLLAWKLLHDRVAALMAAMLFALHPAQVESVAWVTVPDPLMSAGVLCTVLLYLRYARGFPGNAIENTKLGKGARPKDAPQPSARWPIASAAACFLTLFTKETAIILPVLIFALGLFRPRSDLDTNDAAKNRGAGFGTRLKQALLQISPFAAVTILYLLVRYHALGGKLSSPTQHLPWSTMLLSWPATLWFYVKVVFWPIRSHAFADPVLVEGFSVSSVLLPALGVGCAIAVLAGVLVWVWRKAGRDLVPEEAIGVKYALLLGTLLLVLPILPTLDLNALSPGDSLHGRYTYLPLAGLMLLVSTGWRVAQKYRMPLLCAIGVLGAVFAALTVSQEQQWRNDSTIVAVARQNAPHNAPIAQTLADERVHTALQLNAEGRYSEALPILEQITAEHPQDWYAWATLADCYYHLDNLPEAEKSLHRAADLSHKPEVLQQWQELREEMGLPSAVPPQ
ncbi:MAG: tetratricopeptide repeat protein [Terracidiphilus sp.]